MKNKKEHEWHKTIRCRQHNPIGYAQIEGLKLIKWHKRSYLDKAALKPLP